MPPHVLRHCGFQVWTRPSTSGIVIKHGLIPQHHHALFLRRQAFDVILEHHDRLLDRLHLHGLRAFVRLVRLSAQVVEDNSAQCQEDADHNQQLKDGEGATVAMAG